MTRSEKEILEDYKRLIKQITGFKEYEENYGVCLQFVTSNMKYHRFLGVDSHKVTRTLQGVLEKFRVHSEEKKYTCLKSLSEKFLDLPVFEQRENGKTDTHYSVLQFLMLIANNPVNKEYVETKRHVIPEIKEDFNWGEYLLEGVERYFPTGTDDDLSDWSDNEEFSDSEEMRKKETTNNIVVSQDDKSIQPYIVSDGSLVQWEEPSSTLEGMDWLTRNLVSQYWKGEKIDIDLGRYKACRLNNDWEAYKRSINPLSGLTQNTVVTENIVMREVLWMLMGFTDLFLFDFNGKYFVPKQRIAVPHLSEEALHEYLSDFTKCGSYIKNLEDFTFECYHDNINTDPKSQTLEAFSCTVGDFLQKFKMELSGIEQKLIKQEEILTLIDLAKILKPAFSKVHIVYLVYMKGVYQARNFPLQTHKATQLLTVLYNMLVGCDTLFKSPDDDDKESESETTLNLLLQMWLQTSQPYINIVDTWISHGYLRDTRKEFVIHRNKDIQTMDETFWEKSFVFHAINKTLNNEPDNRIEDETWSTDWVPKFLQPVLQQIVLTGKSMEMLEGLGWLAKLDGKTSLSTKEFKEGHLFDKFLTSLKNLLGVKDRSDQAAQDQSSENKEQPTSKIFTEDIDRQMKEKDVFDSFLKIHFENLMQRSDVKDSFLQESLVQTMKTLNLEHMKPIELILHECLYPHIQLQYENVCGRLVDILIKQYHLLDYLDAMRKFFLMEAGDTMFIFYTEIFDKIRLHDHWKDTTSLTFALHDALDSHYPEEVSRLNVLVESSDGQRDSQPINVTDCLTLQYQIPSPVDVVINEQCQLIYNQVFRFLLKVKRAKYCLDELRFYDLQKPSEMSASDRLLSAASSDNSSRPAKLHRMHLLRMKLLHFVNNLHNYMMTRILHIVGMEFHNLTQAKDLDQIIEKHANYVKKIHESCLLHRKNAILKEAVLKVLNLTLRFQTEWDQGVDSISMSQIEETEMEFSRCIQFLSSFLNSVIQRGSFPHLEALAFGLIDLIPKT